MTNNNSEQKPATLDDVVVMLGKTNALLDEVATWLRVSSYDKVKKLLEDTLDTPEKRMIYHLSDGKTTREIHSTTGVHFTTVASYWRSWYKTGLMKSMPVKGGDRYIRNFDLKDFGIDLPKIIPKLPSSPPQEQVTAAVVQNQTEGKEQ